MLLWWEAVNQSLGPVGYLLVYSYSNRHALLYFVDHALHMPDEMIACLVTVLYSGICI